MELGDCSSDDDIEIRHESASSFWVVSRDDSPVSFTILPYAGNDPSRVTEREVYLRGSSDNGMSLYLRVFSWKLELETEEMKLVFYLKTDKYWIKLLKPRKSYEDIIRSILTVVHTMNYVLLKPEASEKAVWDHLKELFPSWEVEPNIDDFTSHITVIRHLLSLSPRFAASRALQTMDIGLSRKALRPATTEVNCQNRRKRVLNEAETYSINKKMTLEGGLKFDEEKGSEKDAGMDEVVDLSEAVCCICDNGGEVTGCDGPCMRSFHVNEDASGADDSSCETLGFSKSIVQQMDKFYCPNCQAKEHQCYACGELGPSDETVESTQKVYVCDAAMCGRFYHPRCVADHILRDKNESEKASLVDSIRDGKGFVCPMHKCWKCGKGEVKEKKDLQFGICRRCPQVWHRKCFPSYILFSEQIDTDSESRDMVARAWDGLLQDRILLYCKRHIIIPSLGTPERTHVKFPASCKSTSTKASVQKKSHLAGDNVNLKTINPPLRKMDNSSKSMVQNAPCTIGASSGQVNAPASADWLSKKQMDFARSKQSSGVVVLRKLESSSKDEKSHSNATQGKIKGNRIADSSSKPPPSMPNTDSSNKPPLSKPNTDTSSKPPLSKPNTVSRDIQRVVDDIINKAKEKVTLESITNKHQAPTNYRSTNVKDRKHSMARIESITKGMRKALETLDHGGSIEDAKMKCSPDLIKYLELCKNDLRVYLSPLLYGARYTSYGRHFTKVEKLEQIAERLHWYVNNDDMIVDFCCGANDFSLLMKEKLEKEGKSCHYKNFDAIQSKNNFCFSKRDWFTVQKDELLDGDRLIIGLNPPFGVKAALANLFIDHALRFRPKLLVLIVPRETKRLDQKYEKYDLIWDDPDLLEGKSFYLPGSVDISENPLSDWNNVPSPLYLWSRTDWTARHRQVAFEVGHITSETSTRYADGWNKRREQERCPATTEEGVVSSYGRGGADHPRTRGVGRGLWAPNFAATQPFERSRQSDEGTPQRRHVQYSEQHSQPPRSRGSVGGWLEE